MTSRQSARHDEHPERRPHRIPAGMNQNPVGLYVDRLTGQWVVRDPQGEFWTLETDAWDERRPFELSDETELEIVPSHYRHMLNLPV